MEGNTTPWPWDELNNMLRISGPVALVNLCTYLLQITDLVVLGHAMNSEALASACLSLVVANLTQEPACFIVANAMTTLLTDAFHARSAAYLSASTHRPQDFLIGAFFFCLLLSLPIGALMCGTPMMLSLLGVPGGVVAAAWQYAPLYAFVVTPALLQSSLLGYLRAQRRLQTATVCVASVACNLALALFLVPSHGLRGSVAATALTRCFAVAMLLIVHRDSMPLSLPEFGHEVVRHLSQCADRVAAFVGSFADAPATTTTDGSREPLQARRHSHPPTPHVAPDAAGCPRLPPCYSPTSPPLLLCRRCGPKPSAPFPWQIICGLYVASVLPSTLRIGGFQLLTLLAFLLSGAVSESVGVALTTLLLQAFLSFSMVSCRRDCLAAHNAPTRVTSPPGSLRCRPAFPRPPHVPTLHRHRCWYRSLTPCALPPRALPPRSLPPRSLPPPKARFPSAFLLRRPIGRVSRWRQ